METPLLHLIPSLCGVLRPEHVCWSCGGELPQMQRRVGEGGEGSKVDRNQMDITFILLQGVPKKMSFSGKTFKLIQNAKVGGVM